MTTISADVLHDHLRYTAWASDRLVRAVERLPSEQLNHNFHTSGRSILGTLVHIFAADRVWLGRIEGSPPENFVTESDYNLHVVQIDWPLLSRRWLEWIGTHSDESIRQPLTYRDLKGNEHTNPLWEIVLHVVNHGAHHRGQVSGFLRALGHTPPPLDLIRFYWDKAAAAAG